MKRAMGEKEREQRAEENVKVDLGETPPVAAIENVTQEFVTRELNTSVIGASHNMDENADPNKPDTGEWSKEASALTMHRSLWDATPADVPVGKALDRIRQPSSYRSAR